MRSRLSLLLVLIGAFALTAIIYWPGLNGPLILDDVANLNVLRRLDALSALSLSAILAEKGPLLDARPVAWLSFLLNWRLSGDDIWALKLTNLSLHLVNGLLAFLLARILLRFFPAVTPRSAPWIALFAAAFWLLSPAQVSSVLYVIQRMAMLSCAFTLLGMLAWCRARLLYPDRPREAVAFMAAAVLVCLPLAVLSKQNGVLLVLLLLLTEVFVIGPAGVRSRMPARMLSLAIATGVALAGLRFWFDPGWLLDAYAFRDFTVVERLLTQPRVLIHYLLNVLQLPGGTPLGLFHDDFQPSRTLFDPPTTVLALAFWIMVPIAAWRLRRTSAALPLFGLVFFLGASSLEAGPFALEIYFEHRSYLPSFGLALSVAGLVAIASRRFQRPRLAATLCAVLLAGYATLTAARVSDWTSWASIVEVNAHSHPASVRAQTGLAVLAFQSGRLDDGLGVLERIRRLGGRSVEPGLALHTLTGYCLAGVPPPDSAAAALAGLDDIGDDPYTVGALRWYREAVTGGSCPDQRRHDVAIQIAQHVLSRPGPGPRRGNWILHDETARLLAAAGEPSVARLHLSRAVRFAPPSARPELRARQAALGGD